MNAVCDHVIQVSRLVTCGRSGFGSFQVITLHCGVYGGVYVCECVFVYCWAA